MAHFAKLDENNIVTQVIAVHNNEMIDESGQESEAKGIEFCRRLFGGTWVQTSYNNSIRKNFAGQGDTYDSERDAFIPPKPFSSWVLNEDTCLWEAPISYPNDGSRYDWHEPTTSWIKITE